MQDTLTTLLKDKTPPISNALITIDKALIQLHQREFNTIIRKNISLGTIKKFRHKRSKNDELIQIADMISGSIFHKFEKLNNTYFNIISKKED